ILEPFVSAAVVAPRHLEQQFLDLIEAAQPVARDGVGQAGAQHDELMLPLAFRRPDGTPYGTVETPELALGARIHVAHAAHDGMRLVVQVQAVADELFQLDLRRAFGTATIKSSSVAAGPAPAGAIPAGPISPGAVAARTIATRSGPVGGPLRAATFPRRTVFLPLLLLLLWHLLNLCHQSGPFHGHQARGPQLHFRRFPAHHLADQMGTQLLEFTVARAAQNPVEAPLETPGALDLRAAAVGVAPVETAQLIQELPGHPKIVNQPGHRILEIGGIVEVAPLQNAAQQVDAVLARRLGQIQIAAGLFVYRGNREIRL